MPKTDEWVGKIFTIPLLGGGYGFGYVTFYDKGLMTLVNIYDAVEDQPKVPADLTTKPILLYDVIVGAEFLLGPKHKAGERWKLTKALVTGPVGPRNRFYRMGGPPRSFRRIDILQEEPDKPLSPEEAEKYPAVSSKFPPFPTAMIEVALKRLMMSPDDLIKSWRARGSAVS